MNERAFLGRGVKFPLQIDPGTGRLAMVDQEEDIREAIGIILNTVQGERVMRPEFGSNVIDYVFAPASSSTRHSLAQEVREQLLYQEPRIVDLEVECGEMDRVSGTILINVSYTVRSTNNRYNQVYPFYVTEGSKGGGAE